MSIRTLLLALLAVGTGFSQTPGPWTPELSMQVDTIGEVVPSPDGHWAAYTATRAVMEPEKSEMLTQIFLSRTDGSRRLQLSRGEKSSHSPTFSPDGQFIYFLSERSGHNNVWRISILGGEAVRLTDWEGALGSYGVSPDGKWIAFTGRPKDKEKEKAKKEKRDFRMVDEEPNNHSLWVVPADLNDGETHKKKPKQLFEAAYHVSEFRWSPDSRRIVFEHWPRAAPDYWLQSDISEVEVEGGQVRAWASSEFSERSPRYSPDGRWVAFVQSSHMKNWSREGRLVLLARQGGTTKKLPVTKDEFGRGSNLLGFSGDSRKLYFTETDGTANVLQAIAIDGEVRTVYRPSRGTLSSYGRGTNLNHASTSVGLVQESAADPPEAYVLDVAEGRAAQVSRVNTERTQPPLGKTEIVRWKSKDGLEVEGLLTYPVGHERGKKVPLMLVIHGGPMGVFTDTFVGTRGLYPLAAFAAKGYAVLRPNPRGSSGYGKQFRMANYEDWGGGDYEDIMSGVDHVIGLGVADPDRLAVMGWSYGGFMTSWVITHTQRFKAACVGAAVTNLWSFTGTSDILDFLPDYFRGEPWENFEAYRRHSPMSFVKGVTTPTLILHGEEDVRVPISQGYELYHALKRQGVTTGMVVYPRTPHGVREPKFLLDVMKRHLGWVEKHL